jgi:mannosylglycerate hydrolase MGH1-like protein
MSDPLVLLARADKWFLSATDGIAFAPPFPRWLDAPGFWDEATLYHYSFAPLFTVTAIDGDGREIAMRPVARRWTPAELTVDYRLANGMMASEVRTVQPGGVFASEWLVQGLRHAPLHLIAWTAHDAADVDRWSIGYDGAFAFNTTVYDERGESLLVRAELACYGTTASYAGYLAARVPSAPRWELTPFVEKWAGEGLPSEIRIEGNAANAMLFGAVHRELAVSTDGAWATFAMRLAALELPQRAGTVPEPPSPPIMVAAGSAGAGTGVPAHAATLGGSSRRRWADRFARSPDFRCSDPYFEHYYWYRWYGLWLNAIEHDAGAIGAPAMCEGIGELHTPSAHAAPGNVRELRWLDSPEIARGAMRALFAHQRDDGSVPARIFADHRSVTGVAQSNWGDAILALDVVWPNDSFLREMYEPLSRYADWLLLSRDAESSGLIDIMAPREIGERHSSRFESVDPGGARDELAAGARLKGVDVTTYAYSLARALETMAHRAGHPPDARRWRLARERIGAALRTRMWDADDEMFSDIDAGSGNRTRVKSAHAFYPYATDLVTAPDVAGLERHLLDPAEFWTPFPVPVTAVDDPFFSAYGEWKGQRQSQPWNGRVWPSVNSSVMDALGSAAASHSPALREEAALFLRRFVRMMFHAGDLGRPNAFEHYNPQTGQASVYRGLDDVQRSWVADHIVSYVMGIRPHDGGITIDPFPFGLERAEITGVHARGRTIDMRILEKRVIVTIDGAAREGVLGEGLEIPD